MILAIESSCDESAIAVFDPSSGMVEEWVHSQIDLHKEYGGVVPELAAREHLEHFFPFVEKVKGYFEEKKISQIAVTVGPGLAGSLAIGMSVAKSLSLLYGVPIVGVNHLRSHVFSSFIALHGENAELFRENYQELLPHLGLLVSGGNTALVSLSKEGRIEILAETVDDAAGEALDKGAKLLGLPYPGGPSIEKIALDGSSDMEFPIAFPEKKIMRFSFSGLKTSLRYRLEKMSDSEVEAQMPTICASYQHAVVKQLIRKAEHVLQKQRFKSFGLSGGVANNNKLRSEFEKLGVRKKVPTYIAKKKHTGDNAAMIAFSAYLDQVGLVGEGLRLAFNPGLRLDSEN